MKILKNNYFRIAAGVIFAACGAVTTLCLSSVTAAILLWEDARIPLVLGVALSFGALLLAALKYDFLENAFRGLRPVSALMSLALAIVAVQIYYPFFSYSLAVIASGNGVFWFLYTRFLTVFSVVCGVFAFVLLARFINWFTGFLKELFSSLDLVERRFLIVGFAAFTLLILAAYLLSNAFYAPSGAHSGGTLAEFDVLFDADSGILIKNNEYIVTFAPENDIRNILFGLFTMPFGLAAKLLALLVSFVFEDAYPFFLSLIQMSLLLICDILVCRMTGLKGSARALFLTIEALSFPSLLTVLVFDQFGFGTFWLIMLVYYYVTGRENRDMLFIGAAGCVATSGLFLPLISGPGQVGIKTRLLDFCRCAAKALGVFSVFGYLPYLVNVALGRLGMWLGAAGGVPLRQKLLQFTVFARSCFFFPPAGEDLGRYYFPVYRALPVTEISVAGAVVIAAALLCLIINRKDRFTRLCGIWTALCVGVVVIVGWGAPWNAMTLYCWYFSWAYLSLTCMLLNRAVKPERVKTALFIALAACTAAVNLYGIYRMIEFSVKYYPC